MLNTAFVMGAWLAAGDGIKGLFPWAGAGGSP